MSVQCWYLLFAPPPAAKHAFQRSSDQQGTCGNWFQKQFFILQNWTVPSSSRCAVWECRRRLITFFEISNAKKEDAPGSTSIQILSFIGRMFGKSNSLLCGFAFAFDLAAKTLTIGCDACSSGGHARTSVLLQFESWICLIHEKFWPKIENYLSWETRFWLQFHVCRTDNWSLFPMRVQFLCFPESILLVVMIRHFLGENVHDKLSQRTVLQCLWSCNTVQSQHDVQILHPDRIYSLCFLVKVIWCSWYCCHRT